MKNKTNHKHPTADQNTEGSERARPILHQQATKFSPTAKLPNCRSHWISRFAPPASNC